MACTPYTSTPYGFAMVVSSTTRPTTAPDLAFGRVIAEADTGRILWYDGTGWIILSEPSQTITTANFTGFTGGTPTYSTTYHRQDGWVDVNASVTFGTLPTMGAITWVPPIAGSLPQFGGLEVQMLDTSLGNWFTGKRNGSLIYSALISGTTIVATAISATVPFTWAAGDGLYLDGRYRMASRYS